MPHSTQASSRDTMHDRRATIYRIVSPEHVCPFGEAAIELLEREGYEIDDHLLRSRPETEAYMKQEDVQSTPQIFIDGERVGGYDDLVARLGS